LDEQAYRYTAAPSTGPFWPFRRARIAVNTALRYVKNPSQGKWNRKMKTYHVAISLEVAADDEEEAAREAMTKVIDPTMVIEAITELHGHDEEQD
jgi:hypothetical protein